MLGGRVSINHRRKKLYLGTYLGFEFKKWYICCFESASSFSPSCHILKFWRICFSFRLKKNLKNIYFVHQNLWLKTMIRLSQLFTRYRIFYLVLKPSVISSISYLFRYVSGRNDSRAWFFEVLYARSCLYLAQNFARRCVL